MEQAMFKIARDIIRAYQIGELPTHFTQLDFRDLEFLYWCYNNKINYSTVNSKIADYVTDKDIKVTESNGFYHINFGG